MPESGEDQVLNLFHSLSRPVRYMIIDSLRERDHATFSELLITCDLDIYYQKGLLDYHLKELCKSGILAKTETGYELTNLGKIVARFLESMKHEYRTLFTAKESVKGGENVKLSIDTFEEKDAEQISIAKYGTKEKEKDEKLWTCGNRVPFKHMSEWGTTVSLMAKSDGKIIGVLYGNTIPMHVVTNDGEKIGVVQPTKDKPANRLDGEIFEIWVHPEYEDRDVERQLIKRFMDRMKEQGAVAVLAERVLTENESLISAFKEVGFQKMASYQDFMAKI